jgi:hypothetical protein
MFASRVTRDVEVEGEGGAAVFVTVQKLSARSLEKAREAKSAAQLASLRAASKDMLQVWRSAEVEEAAKRLAEKRAQEVADPKARAKARYDAHDREHVLLAGVVRWTAKAPNGEPIPVAPEHLLDLDEATAQTLHEAILDLSLPPLDPADAEAVLAKG